MFRLLQANAENYAAELVIGLIGTLIVTVATSAYNIFRRFKFDRRGIRKTTAVGHGIRRMRRAIEQADEVRVIAIAGNGFLAEHEQALIDQFKTHDNFKLKLLLADPASEFTRELEKMEGKTVGKHVACMQNATAETINAILRYVKKPPGDPAVEIRHFHTEFRNSLVICRRRETGRGGKGLPVIQAWLTLALPPVPDEFLVVAKKSPTLEFTAERSALCSKHFDELWNRYSPDNLIPRPISSGAGKRPGARNVPGIPIRGKPRKPMDPK
ncbi:MAG: hypothetical protein LBJ11_11715 [Oscillospiraceae bacterium]|jgi:hypothetical protein|nr:hypothetical protein [Oscillospiraceae bacterium]